MHSIPSAPIRVASVGAGWVTLNRHIPALRRLPDFDVVGIVDRDPDRARRTAIEHRLRRWAASTSLDVPWLDEVDAVTIGTPPATHVDLARAALAAGKHVLMEKPVGIEAGDANLLRSAAEAAQRTIAVVHNFQFARSALTLQRRLATGAFGRITGVFALQFSNPRRRLPVWYENLPLGLFYDESPHLLYLIRSLAGEPTLTAAHVVPSRAGAVTPAEITAHFDCGGIPATLYMNFEAPLSEWHLCVNGERGCAVVDVFRDILVEVPEDDGHRALDILRSSAAGTLTHWLGVLRSGALLLRKRLLYGNEEVVRRFAAAVRTGNPPPGISIDDAARILRLQHAILATGRDSLGAGPADTPPT